MDVNILQQAIQSLGFPITMVAACSWFIWKMYQVQIQDKERLYTELGKAISANERFSEIISTYTSKLDAIQDDVQEIKEKVSRG